MEVFSRMTQNCLWSIFMTLSNPQSLSQHLPLPYLKKYGEYRRKFMLTYFHVPTFGNLGALYYYCPYQSQDPRHFLSITVWNKFLFRRLSSVPLRSYSIYCWVGWEMLKMLENVEFQAPTRRTGLPAGRQKWHNQDPGMSNLKMLVIVIIFIIIIATVSIVVNFIFIIITIKKKSNKDLGRSVLY